MTPPADTGLLTDRIRAVVEQAIAGTDLFLIEVKVRGHTGSRVLEIYIDSDGLLSVDRLAEVNRDVGFLLETEQVVDGKYLLNVSSPGVDRPLALPRQYRKNIGRRLEVKVRRDEEMHTMTGTLVAAGDDALELETESKETQRIPYQEVEQARIRLPW